MANKKVSVTGADNGSTIIAGSADAIIETLEAATSFLNNTPKKNKVEIKGAQINGAFLNYNYELEVKRGTVDKLGRKGGLIAHTDAFTAFGRLNKHLACYCEELQQFEFDDIDQIENYNPDTHKEDGLEKKVSQFFVTSFALEGEGDKESVKLTGFKTLSTGEPLGLSTPKIKWSGEYRFVNELRADIDLLKLEVEAYMNGTKLAPYYDEQDMFEMSQQGAEASE